MSWHQETSCRQSKKITLLFLFCYFEAAFISGSWQKRRRIKVEEACPWVVVTSCGQLSINFVLTPDRKVKGKKYCDFSWVSLLAARVSSLCVRDNSHWQSLSNVVTLKAEPQVQSKAYGLVSMMWADFSCKVDTQVVLSKLPKSNNVIFQAVFAIYGPRSLPLQIRKSLVLNCVTAQQLPVETAILRRWKVLSVPPTIIWIDFVNFSKLWNKNKTEICYLIYPHRDVDR